MKNTDKTTTVFVSAFSYFSKIKSFVTDMVMNSQHTAYLQAYYNNLHY